MNETDLPCNGVWHIPQDTRHDETVVFVHHFGGSRSSPKRHIQLVNNLGFKAVSFDLEFTKSVVPKKLPITSNMEIGAYKIWRDEIERILNAIPGKKIIYAFSGPSLGAICAIGNRRAVDIVAVIFDSGPFFQISRCYWNLLTNEYRIENPIKRLISHAIGLVAHGMDYQKEVSESLQLFPTDLPILSIRGWEDPLVPLQAIDEVFNAHGHIDLEVFNLPKGKHLDGLRNFPEEYKGKVEAFLNNSVIN